MFKKISPFFVYQISGNSMAPAFSNDEKVLVFVWAYIFFTPRINDVVICMFNKKKLIKRIQRIEQNEAPRVNTRGIFSTLPGGAESAEAEISSHSSASSRSRFSAKVDKIFVVGDNKKESTDSRNFGYLSIKNILGKVIFKI